jgi:hypothetical protein
MAPKSPSQSPMTLPQGRYWAVTLTSVSWENGYFFG